MEKIPLPSSITVYEKENKFKATVIVSPCYPGYGTTLGNALRRVLLSSLPGGAVTAVKVEGVDHEFSSLSNIKEDMVEIILNLKQLRLRLHGDEPVELELHAKGEKDVTAGDFVANSAAEIVNPDLVLATITDKQGKLDLKVMVQNGRGYVPVESREKEKLALGYIAIDALFSPVKNVNFHTEHVRVGQMTNYDKLFLDITTDQIISPLEAFQCAAQILADQFTYLATPEEEKNNEAEIEENVSEEPSDVAQEVEEEKNDEKENKEIIEEEGKE